jgi:hypothetical protein
MLPKITVRINNPRGPLKGLTKDFTGIVREIKTPGRCREFYYLLLRQDYKVRFTSSSS